MGRNLGRLAGLLVLLAASSPAWGAAAGEGASFLGLPVGGRPAALGGAYSALADDAYAPVWNPGGLGFTQGTQLAAMHAAYAGSTSFDSVSLARRLPFDSGFGLSAQYGDVSGRFGAYGLSLGHAFTPQWSFGLTGKLVETRVGEASAHGLTADIGSLYRADERLSLGFVVANMGRALQAGQEAVPLPRQVRAGATYWPWPGKANFSLEGVYDSSRVAGFRTGAELRLLQFLALRLGLDTTPAATGQAASFGGVTAGVGLELMGQQLDYAWVPRGGRGDTQYFSLVVRFGQPPAPAPAAAAEETAPAFRPAPAKDPYQNSREPRTPSLLWLDY